MTRIIGIELRAYGIGPAVEQEVVTIPVDITLPDDHQFGFIFNVTLHTSNGGDHTFGGNRGQSGPLRTYPDAFSTVARLP